MRQFLDVRLRSQILKKHQQQKNLLLEQHNGYKNILIKSSQEIPINSRQKLVVVPTMISGGKPKADEPSVKVHNELARNILAKYPEVTHFGFG